MVLLSIGYHIYNGGLQRVLGIVKSPTDFIFGARWLHVVVDLMREFLVSHSLVTTCHVGDLKVFLEHSLNPKLNNLVHHSHYMHS